MLKDRLRPYCIPKIGHLKRHITHEFNATSLVYGSLEGLVAAKHASIHTGLFSNNNRPNK